MNLKVRNKFTGVRWAIIFLVICLGAGFAGLESGEIYKAELNFFEASIVAFGTSLYFIRKKRLLDWQFYGSKLIEAILVATLVVLFGLFINTNLPDYYLGYVGIFSITFN